jgi:hypothetical protein
MAIGEEGIEGRDREGVVGTDGPVFQPGLLICTEPFVPSLKLDSDAELDCLPEFRSIPSGTSSSSSSLGRRTPFLNAPADTLAAVEI